MGGGEPLPYIGVVLAVHRSPFECLRVTLSLPNGSPFECLRVTLSLPNGSPVAEHRSPHHFFFSAAHSPNEMARPQKGQ
jgi:hypothetical protein